MSFVTSALSDTSANYVLSPELSFLERCQLLR